MRIKVQLPKVDPETCKEPEACPYENCNGRHFKPHGQKGEVKEIRDLYHQEVKSYRWKCMKCRRTFRVYPQGVSNAQQSAQLKAMSVLLYVLGLSYGAVSDFLTAMGVSIGKTTVYENVQEAGERSRVRQAREIEEGGKRAAMGTDGTYVKVKGEKVGLEVLVDDESGDLLGLEIIVSENAEELLEIIREVAEKVEVDVLISDDLDTYKNVADELGLEHQTCRSHINRNVEDGVESMRKQARKEEEVPEGVDSSLERLEADLTQIEQIVHQRPDDGAEQLETLYHRYKAAPPPTRKGERHSVWYRVRMLITRRWENWRRLTLELHRSDLDLDGTNNSSERLIGWFIKERYRTMRGYKRTESIKNVVTLTARMGVRSGDYDMAELYA
jgi:transposase-like protein